LDICPGAGEFLVTRLITRNIVARRDSDRVVLYLDHVTSAAVAQ